MPPAFAQELALSAEQQKKVQALDGEFRSKRQEMAVQCATKIWSIVGSLDEAEDKREPAPVLAIAHEVTGSLLNMRRMRLDYEHKMLALLSDEQRDHFTALKEYGLRDRISPASFESLPVSAERKLNLTAEQKQKLAEMRQEWRKQFESILTEDQRQRLNRLNAPARRSGDGEIRRQED